MNKTLCNSKQKWNHDKFCCESKELDKWRPCKICYIWNPSTCDCECNKACVNKINDYLDIKNCSFKKRLIGKLVLKCEYGISNRTKTLVNDKKEV